MALVDDMFQKKIHELFNGMSDVFVISGDILFICFNKQGKDHDETLDKELGVCRQANLRLNKDKGLFRYTSIPFFGEIISWQGIILDCRKKYKH